jgi:hypothetical protein
MNFDNQTTTILEINLERLLLACESRNREIQRITPSILPHSIPVLKNQKESLHKMLAILQSRSNEQLIHLRQQDQQDQKQDTAIVTQKIETMNQLNRRTGSIIEQWKTYINTHSTTIGNSSIAIKSKQVLKEHNISRSTTRSPTLNSISPRSRSPTITPFSTPSSGRTSPNLSKFRNDIQGTGLVLKPSTLPVSTMNTRDVFIDKNSLRSKTVPVPQRRKKKKRNIRTELRSWKRQLGILDVSENDTTTLTGEEERQRIEAMTERSLEEILQTTTSLKGVVQASQSKIQEDLVRIEATSKMVDKNQAAVEKNTKKTKEQSKALWSDMFTEMKMVMYAIVMTLIIVLITRVPVLSLMFRKNF